MAEFEAQAAQFIRHLRYIVPSKVGIERALYRIGMLVELKIKEQIEEKLKVGQGHLKNSIKYEVKMFKDGSGGEVSIYSKGVKYAAIQEYGSAILPGGVIRPKVRKMLSVPLSVRAKRESAEGRGPGSYGKGAHPSRKGWDPNLIRKGAYLKNKGSGENEWVLVKSIKLEPKYFMRDGLAASRARIIEILRALGEDNE